MSTVDTVFLIITACALSLFFLLGSVLLVFAIQIANRVKKVVAKADSVVDSVEAAAEVFKDTSGNLAVIKLVRNIIKFAKKGGQK
jgi:hypothetical protein